MYVSQGNGGNCRPHVSFCQNRLVPAEVYPESADQQIAVRYTHTVIVEEQIGVYITKVISSLLFWLQLRRLSLDTL